MSLTRRKWVKCVGASAAALALPSLAMAGNHANQKIDYSIINAGVGGNNTNEMLARLDKDCLTYKPTLTILMAGTNDMNSVKHVPLNQYEKNMDELATRIKKSGSKLLMLTILPTYEPYLLTRHPAAFYQPEGVAVRRDQVNSVIKSIAKKHRAPLLDIGKRFEAIGKIGLDKESLIQNEANSNKTDGIHPTPNGYRFIALSVFDQITHLNMPLERIVCFGDSITKGDGSTNGQSYPGFLNRLIAMITDQNN